MPICQVESKQFDAYVQFMNWARPRGYTQNITPSGYAKWNDGTTKAMVTPAFPHHRKLMFSTPVIVTFAPLIACDFIPQFISHETEVPQ